MAPQKPWLTRLGERLEHASQPDPALLAQWLAFAHGLAEVWDAAHPHERMDEAQIIALAYAEASKGWSPGAAWTAAMVDAWEAHQRG